MGRLIKRTSAETATLRKRGEGNKWCYLCYQNKLLTEFHKDKSSTTGRAKNCKKCANEVMVELRSTPTGAETNRKNVAKWREANPEKQSALNEAKREKYNSCEEYSQTYRKRAVLKYGISIEEYDRMLEAQGNVCAICKLPERATNKRSGRVHNLAVDHCHDSGKVRGLLCSNCNTAIGLLKENADLFQSAVNYLKENN